MAQGSSYNKKAIWINEDLHQELKVEAARRGMFTTALIEEKLRK